MNVAPIILAAVALATAPLAAGYAPVPKPPEIQTEKQAEELKVGQKVEGKVIKKVVQSQRAVIYVKPSRRSGKVYRVQVPPSVAKKVKPGTVVEVYRTERGTVVRPVGGAARTGGGRVGRVPAGGAPATPTARGGTTVTPAAGHSPSYAGHAGARYAPSGEVAPSSQPTGAAGAGAGAAGAAGGVTAPATGAGGGGGGAGGAGGGAGGAGATKKQPGEPSGGKKEVRGKSAGKPAGAGPAKRGQAGPGSAGVFSREALSSGGEWLPYLAAVALVGTAAAGAWAVLKRRRESEWEL